MTREGVPAFVAMHIPNSKYLGWDEQVKPQIAVQTGLFSQCSSKHVRCIKGIFAGHVHLFLRNMQTASNPGNVPTLVVPSVTPMNGAIPGYLIITYDRDNGKLTQVQRFYLDNYGTTLAGKVVATPVLWSRQTLK